MRSRRRKILIAQIFTNTLGSQILLDRRTYVDIQSDFVLFIIYPCHIRSLSETHTQCRAIIAPLYLCSVLACSQNTG